MIRYSDSEVRVFHPICQKALGQALKLLGKDEEYEVLHHQYTAALEMDFVIRNKHTMKYFCVIEVKRTPSDVQSTRYQIQAESYVQMNSGQNEKNFYILTNLEQLISFCYSPMKPRVYQQVLKPGLEQVCDFSQDNEETIVEKLSQRFKNIFSELLANRYEYSTTLDDFISYMADKIADDRLWKSCMAIFLYEYIRGVFSAVRRPDLRYDVRIFNNDVQQICMEGNKVDFDGIFGYSEEQYAPAVNVEQRILSEMYLFGQTHISGNSVAGALYSKIAETKKHDGEVATDTELASLASVLAKKSNGMLEVGQKICDPAAGSGNLICSAIGIFNAHPNDIKANDVNAKLIELLSLRLGLSFPAIIKRDNAPQISIKNLIDLDREYFEDVSVVLLNPPFVAGINCVDRKQGFYRKIKELKGREADTVRGQANLGAVFLETVCHLVKQGTTIVCIFPKAHLTARGEEAIDFRKMLLNTFGLHMIFNYPAEGLFDDVVEETCIFVGKARSIQNTIEVFSSNEKVADIDLHALESYDAVIPNDKFTTIIPGIEARCLDRTELIDALNDGWRMVCSEMTDSIDFVSSRIFSNNKMLSIETSGFPCRRGNVGASGASDLVFFDSIPNLYNKYIQVNTTEGLRNAQLDSFELNYGDSKFLDFNLITDAESRAIVSDYLPLQRAKQGQQRINKSADEWICIAKRYGRVCFDNNIVLAPTKIRRTGRIYTTNVPMHISTNFGVLSCPTNEDAKLIGSFMTTILYQLECEVQSKDHAGLRKIEINDLMHTHIPNLSCLTKKDRQNIIRALENISFLELNNPVVRDIDRVWARILYGDESEEVLEQAKTLLHFLVNRRNPM